MRRDIKVLEADIERLDVEIKEKASKKATALARMQSRLFLEQIFSPYINGVCKVLEVSPVEGIRKLILDNNTVSKLANNNPAAVSEFLDLPEMKILIIIARPLKNVSKEWIEEKMDILFEVMSEIRPELAKIITDTPNGIEWFYDSLTGLRDILFSSQLNR